MSKKTELIKCLACGEMKPIQSGNLDCVECNERSQISVGDERRLRADKASLIYAVVTALELIDDLRGYCRAQWDYKHGERWDSEKKIIEKAAGFAAVPSQGTPEGSSPNN
jgi:hypothetical protein